MPIASTLTTLVVDDQASIRALICKGLEELGFRDITEALDGEDGLRTMLTRTPTPKLIISDYNMPKLDGMGFLRAIRMHGPTKTTPFIMLTGSAEKEVVQTAKQHGVNNYLVKPFAVTTLKDKIEAVMGKLT